MSYARTPFALMLVGCIFLLFAFMVLVASSAATQAQEHASATDDNSSSVTPAVSFELEWPEADPNWFSITVSADGSATYKSQEKGSGHEVAGEPYTVKFTATEATLKRIFDLAKELNYFHGDFDYRSGNVAFTGKKTLRYVNGPGSSETVLNYSGNAEMMDLVGIFQKISSTIELGRRIDFKLRFDKLGVDADLKGMENLSKRGALLEIQTVAPVLQRVLDDRGTMNISRQRIQHILEQNRSK